ncbi:MAG TPA: LCP family protein [Candidatus Limnocylindrales bacterium]|nr:LCP family protein [Candidatus Limnocylindrales bacterium]
MNHRGQQPIRKRVLAVIIIFFVIIAGIFVVKGGQYFPAIFQLLFEKNINLKTTDEKRVNILLLGIGGGTHDGPDLTDTMIFASIDVPSKKVTLVSIPRDLWMPELQQKVNFAYAHGEVKRKGGGILESRASVEKLLGQEIDYVFRMDFDGFVKAIDMVGGLEIMVDNSLDDSQYPLTGKENDSCGLSEEKIASLSAELATGSATEDEAFPCRYERLQFAKGLQKMDGISALKFVRSRHAKDGEGSDFARSKRQEKVINAFKEKIFSANTFLNPVRLISLADVFKDSIDTDIKNDEYDDFVKLAQKIKGAKTKSVILDLGSEAENRYGLLTQPPITREYKNQYVIIPRTGNGRYDEIQKYVKCEIEIGDCMVGKSGIITPTPKPTSAKPKN